MLAPEDPVGVSEQEPKPRRRYDNQRERRDKIEEAFLRHPSEARLKGEASRREVPDESGVGQTPDGWRMSSTCRTCASAMTSVGTGMLSADAQ